MVATQDFEVERGVATADQYQLEPRLLRPRLVVDNAFPRAETRWLRWLLVGVDTFGIAFGWGASVLVGSRAAVGTSMVAFATGLIVTIAAIALQRLYLARVSCVRSVELERLAHAAVAGAFAVYGTSGAIGSGVSALDASAAGALTFLLLATGRSFYDAWLKIARSRGRFLRSMVVVGANAEGAHLVRLLDVHPELGFRVRGIIGRADGHERPDGVPVVGEVAQVVDAVRSTGATGVMIASSALTAQELNTVTRELLLEGVHVHVSIGLKGISTQRLRPLPFAREPLFYVERLALSRWQATLKRAIDLALAVTVAVLTLPLLIVTALAIKLEDRGRVFFLQERVGRDGRHFTMWKFRTMAPDADARAGELCAHNNRSGGPLFKMDDDPRQTRVGRVLETLSIDELPQLWNVLRGNMSLVGPRPGLPEEIEQFEEELLVRLSVPPGVTGLWQAEARDNPRFDAYCRLDLFYVENWSLAFDLSIILATLRSLVVRVVHSIWRHPASGARAGATGSRPETTSA